MFFSPLLPLDTGLPLASLSRACTLQPMYKTRHQTARSSDAGKEPRYTSSVRSVRSTKGRIDIYRSNPPKLPHLTVDNTGVSRTKRPEPQLANKLYVNTSQTTIYHPITGIESGLISITIIGQYRSLEYSHMQYRFKLHYLCYVMFETPLSVRNTRQLAVLFSFSTQLTNG
jgi:hypothetical protein